MTDLGREAEVYLRGYVGEHTTRCPCANECPLELALHADPRLLDAIDKTQPVYKSLPQLVGHVDKYYEYYLERCALFFS